MLPPPVVIPKKTTFGNSFDNQSRQCFQPWKGEAKPISALPVLQSIFFSIRQARLTLLTTEWEIVKVSLKHTIP